MKKFLMFFGIIILLFILGFGYFLKPGLYVVKSSNVSIKETDGELIIPEGSPLETPVPKKVLREYWSQRLPKRVSLLVFKQERVMEVWSLENNKWEFIDTYPILAASGSLGPKLQEGDCQVPEGIYKVVGLNPNSRFHRSLLLDYPNAFDRAKAKLDGRTNLGGAICIHGGSASIGCIAMGDEVSEDLFWLASQIGMSRLKVIIAPYDFRMIESNYQTYEPEWTKELYEILKNELKQF